jgi:triacylglycerol lipase
MHGSSRSAVFALVLIASLSVPTADAKADSAAISVPAPEADGASIDPPDSYTHMRYPLILVPGAILFDMPVDAWSYWFGIVEALQKGGAEVFVSRLPVGSDTTRGTVLLQEIRTVMALTGKSKVNLLGYSQGGQTCRYALAMQPQLIASVTTVAAPHRGSQTADSLLEPALSFTGRVAKAELLRLINGLATQLSVVPHLPKDFEAALRLLSTQGAAAFNERFPAGLPTALCGDGAATSEGARLYSWGGVGGLTNLLDISDPLFLSASLMGKNRSDGLVDSCSSHFGTVIRDDYRANHFDQINQLFGLSAWQGMDPRAVYRAHANRLKNAGL